MRGAILFSCITLLALLASCAPQGSFVGNANATAEIGRLSYLAAQGALTQDDIAPLAQHVEGDEYAEHKYGELEKMVAYGEQYHAGHALSFLGSYAETGTPVTCPAHEIAHYYVYMRHGDEHEAEHALEHAHEQLAEWIPKARAYGEQYGLAQDLDAIIATIQAHLERIDAGDTAANDEEIAYLAGEASVCV